VVGRPESRDRIRPKWKAHYGQLVAFRDYLLKRQSDLTKDAVEEAPSFSLHMADAGTDHYDRDLALGMLSQEQDAVYEIDQALNRIRDGTYGVCELTGQPIEPERLTAIPWTRFSAAAERRLEHEGAIKSARLGTRRTVARESSAKQNEDSD
jgi:RNA polymerase-binding transcription factor DksA